MMRSSPCRAARARVALMAVVLMAGCALNRPAIVKQTFLLDPKPLAVAAEPRPGTLRVGTVTVAGAYRGRNFVVREGELQFATDYYHEFVTPVGAMIGELTSRVLAQAGLFAHVASPGSPADADYVLDAFVDSLYSDRRPGSGGAAAELSITFYLSQSDTGSSVPFWSRTYHQRVTLRTDTADAYVDALNTAFGNILAELAKDLATVTLPATHQDPRPPLAEEPGAPRAEEPGAPRTEEPGAPRTEIASGGHALTSPSEQRHFHRTRGGIVKEFVLSLPYARFCAFKHTTDHLQGTVRIESTTSIEPGVTDDLRPLAY